MAKIISLAQLPQEARDLIDEKEIEYLEYDIQNQEIDDKIIGQIKKAQVLISAVSVEVTKEMIEVNPDLKLIANIGAGFNNIDIETAKKHQIPVTNTLGTKSLNSTAEFAIASMLAVSRNVVKNQDLIETGDWEGWRASSYLGGNQITSKSLLIVGFGRIGQMIASKLKNWQMDIKYYDLDPVGIEIEENLNVEYIDIDEGLAWADYVILQMNYTKDNHHFIDKAKLDLMKEDAYLINTARGGIVDESALADALEDNKLAGAAIDTHEFEPKISDRLKEMDNVVLTTHIGNDTYEARIEMAKEAVQNAIDAIEGKEIKSLIEY